jgi:hypothetical protein
MVTFQTAEGTPTEPGSAWCFNGLPFSVMVPAGAVVTRDGTRMIKEDEAKKEGVLAIRFKDGVTKLLRDPDGNYVRKGYDGYVSVDGYPNYWVYITGDMVVKTTTKA